MKTQILNELEKLLQTRVAVYTDKVQIKTHDEENDIHEIILQDCDEIVYNNSSIHQWDEIILHNRKLEFYDETYCGKFCIFSIDLSEGYIEIYKGFEKTFFFVYKEFKPDQTIDKNKPLDLDKYPLLSYSIEESQIRKDYYEIIINVRMSPLDESDYKLRAFYPMTSDFTGALGLIEYYRNKIIKGEFATFFQHDKIKVTTPSLPLQENVIYKILDHHTNEFYFTVQEEGAVNQKIDIPYIDIFDSIKYLD